MADLTTFERILLENAINDKIENLEARARVLDKDILFFSGEECLFDYFDLVIELDDVLDCIADYKEILNKIKLEEKQNVHKTKNRS